MAVHELQATPDAPDRAVTFAELDRDASLVASALADLGVGPESLVVVSLPNVALHAAATFGAWRLGACVLPVSPAMPAPERERLLAVTTEFEHRVTVGSLVGQAPDLPLDQEAVQLLGERPSQTPGPGPVPCPAAAMSSGGTSGAVKVTVDGGRGEVEVDENDRLVLPPLFAAMGGRADQVRLVCTPLHHINGFGALVTTVLAGAPAVLVERFDADRVLAAVERYGVQHLIVVPTILQRLAETKAFATTDLSSVEAIGFGGSHSRDDVVRRWIQAVGPERVYGGYGATEAVGKTVLRGDEWLRRPGSCGRPVNAEVRIIDDAGDVLSAGEIGEVYMRPMGATAPCFRYLGADYRGVTDDGFVSVGDLGWLDEEGYLYLADRRTDLIITGGVNVYPAEVESVLLAHPDVADAVVIGLPDPTWGRRVHAIVVAAADLQDADLKQWCRDRLAAYKCPKSIERLSTLPQTEAGKVSRSRLVAERAEAVP